MSLGSLIGQGATSLFSKASSPLGQSIFKKGLQTGANIFQKGKVGLQTGGKLLEKAIDISNKLSDNPIAQALVENTSFGGLAKKNMGKLQQAQKLNKKIMEQVGNVESKTNEIMGGSGNVLEKVRRLRDMGVDVKSEFV